MYFCSKYVKKYKFILGVRRRRKREEEEAIDGCCCMGHIEVEERRMELHGTLRVRRRRRRRQ